MANGRSRIMLGDSAAFATAHLLAVVFAKAVTRRH
jgi:hypothetical protein